MQHIVVLSERATTSIAMGESHFREFKSAVQGPPGGKSTRDLKEVCTDIAQTLVAFANADGGELLVGVEDNGEVSGVESFKERDILTMEDAPNARIHSDTPLDSVRRARVTLNGHTVLYFSVKKGTDLIHLTSDGRCLQRRDLASVPISTEKIKFDRDESRSRAYDRQFQEGPQADALDLDLVRAVAEQMSRGMSTEKCLQYLDLAEYTDTGLKLRKAALLLFAKDAQRWHPRLQIRIIKVNGTEVRTGAEYNVIADDVIAGNIVHMIEHGWDALRPHLVQTTLRETARFESRVMYPEYACREALVNAIAHRDYSQEGRGIEIFIYVDRMEVVNPGALLSSVTVEDLRRLEGVHQSRNSLIARVLRELGYMRELGEGLRRIFELMTSSELAPPDLRSSRDTFSIALHHKPIYSQKDLMWLAEFDAFNLDREKKAVVLLGRDASVFSPKDIWDALGIVDTEHYRKLVDSLQRMGILVNEVTPLEAKKRAAKKRIPTREFPRFRIDVPTATSASKGLGRAPAPQPVTPKGATTVVVPAQTTLLASSPTRVYVGNLAVVVTKEDLMEAFSPHYEVVDIHLPMNGSVNRGYAVIEFATATHAAAAIAQQHDVHVKGRPMKVREDRR